MGMNVNFTAAILGFSPGIAPEINLPHLLLSGVGQVSKVNASRRSSISMGYRSMRTSTLGHHLILAADI